MTPTAIAEITVTSQGWPEMGQWHKQCYAYAVLRNYGDFIWYYPTSIVQSKDKTRVTLIGYITNIILLYVIDLPGKLSRLS